MNIKFVSINANGDFYVGYITKVLRGIRGKTRKIVDEVLIIGIPKAKMNEFCIQYGIVVEYNTKTGVVKWYEK